LQELETRAEAGELPAEAFCLVPWKAGIGSGSIKHSRSESLHSQLHFDVCKGHFSE